jgi:DNA-directed RNA polymerase subunit alpha
MTENLSTQSEILRDEAVKELLKNAREEAHAVGFTKGVAVGYAKGISMARDALAQLPNTTPLAPLEAGVDYFDLSVRAYNSLIREGIHTIGDLVEKTQEELSGMRTIGPKTLDEIKDELAKAGYSLRKG